jgi:hypothetical protein
MKTTIYWALRIFQGIRQCLLFRGKQHYWEDST